MRALLQRVSEARVDIEGETTGAINEGLLIFLGVADGDDDTAARFVADKCLNLRIFADEKGKFNVSALNASKEILVVSQFTLYADTSKGRRPSFTTAGSPEQAEPIYETFIEYLRESGLRVEAGRFGAAMDVHLVNDGPVTVMVDSNH